MPRNVRVIVDGKIICTACNQWSPATTEYFSPQTRGVGGLRARCKKCAARIKSEREHTLNPSMRKNRVIVGGKAQCSKCERWFDATLDNFPSNPDGLVGIYSICLECSHKRGKDYYRSNTKRVLSRTGRYQRENRERSRGYGRKYDMTHREEKARRRKERRKNDPRLKLLEVVWSHKRRARKRGNGGTHTRADIERQLRAQRGKCYYCKTKLKTYHVDHVVPLSRGGSNDPSNLVVACPSCNMSKHDKLLCEWEKSPYLL